MEMYTFNCHIHRYATWTAARAQRAEYSKNELIRTVINQSDLQTFAEQDATITFSKEQYNEWHSKTCNFLMGSLKEKLNLSEEVPFGIAAKLVSIYLKTAVIFARPEHPAYAYIHPPLDGILLKEVAKKHGKLESLKSLKRETWTTWDQSKYNEIWELLNIEIPQAHLWAYERYWEI